jgi:pilus assembly protein Flp/PilA
MIAAANCQYLEEELKMLGSTTLISLMRAWRDRRGQDLIEYALMAGFVALAAGAIMPGVSSNISTIFSRVGSVMSAASLEGDNGGGHHHR